MAPYDGRTCLASIHPSTYFNHHVYINIATGGENSLLWRPFRMNKYFKYWWIINLQTSVRGANFQGYLFRILKLKSASPANTAVSPRSNMAYLQYKTNKDHLLSSNIPMLLVNFKGQRDVVLKRHQGTFQYIRTWRCVCHTKCVVVLRNRKYLSE